MINWRERTRHIIFDHDTPESRAFDIGLLGRIVFSLLLVMLETLVPGEHPIIPVMLGDAVLAQKMAELLLDEGIYVIGFSYPVVPKGDILLRLIPTAIHTEEDITMTIEAFGAVSAPHLSPYPGNPSLPRRHTPDSFTDRWRGFT